MKKYLAFFAASAMIGGGCAGGGIDGINSQDNSNGERINDSRKYVAAENPVDGQYIVVLNDDLVGIASVESAMTQLQAEYGGDVRRTYGTALNGYSIEMSQSEALDLSEHPMVKYVVENGKVSIDVDQNNATWGLDRVDQRNLPLDSTYTYNADGAGVSAYIIDTGVRGSHVDFSGRYQGGFDAVDNDNDPNDCNGHGTHVAGTMAGSEWGVAKGADVYGVRVLNCQGSGTFEGVIAGIDWVTANAQLPAVANMSLGGGFSQAVNDAVTNSVNAGIVYAVAAGNDNGDACTKSPASTPSALTVGSTTSSDARSSFSNFGTCLDIWAPGSSITSAWHTGDSATNTISGTSMASPHVAGAAVLYLGENPTHTPAQVEAALEGNASIDKVSNPQNGSPNLLLYTAFIGDGGGGGDTTPPTVDLTSPNNGATVSGSVTISAVATDNTGVTSVEFFVDGNSIGSDASAPYSISWNSGSVGNGSHNIEARASDAAGNQSSDSVTVSVSNGGGGGDDQAAYDPALGTAACLSAGSSCDSGSSLFNGRGTLSGGAESNAPNTIDGCADGNSGTYHSDESLDALKVYTLSGNDFGNGETVRVEANVWAWNTGTSDRLDVFYANDASNPTWQLIATVSASGGGAQTLSTSFDLQSGGDLQAIRAQWRYNSTATACASGSYNDRDDLVIRVGGGGGGGNPGTGEAAFDAALGAPACTGAAGFCDSLDLLTGRGTMSGGAESNGSNTIDTCNDGNSGTFHNDESNDRIVISTASGNLRGGATVTVEATVWAWNTGSSDTLDLFYTSDANNPNWTLLTSIPAGGGGERVLSTDFQLAGNSGRHAVRAQFRYNSTADACASGNWNDRDDLVFEVQ